MALTITFKNIGSGLQNLRPEQSDRLVNMAVPVFESYVENLAELTDRLKPYRERKNLLLIGNGGSIWSFMAYWQALSDRTNGQTVTILTDMEPDYLATVRQGHPKATSLVVVVSKSGSTVGVIENILAFWDYDQLFVTDPDGPIGQIARSRQATVINHPAVGGRYAGFTSSAYVPSLLTGLAVEAIEAGGRDGYSHYRDSQSLANPALKLAGVLWGLENRGYTELFLAIYSNFLVTFGMVVTQLFHESFGKAGKGLTVLAAQAPESQHHTNQRFLGGRPNMVGCFVHVKEQQVTDLRLSVPAILADVPLRSGKIGDIDGINLSDSFHAEWFGTYTAAVNQSLPVVDIELSEVSPHSVGEFMAFWHYVTVYSALLRAVDPYDQPQVEASKVISFEERLKALAKT